MKSVFAMILAGGLACFGCTQKDGHYQGERCTIVINGRTGTLLRRDFFGGGYLIVRYADDNGVVHVDSFHESDLEF